MPPSHRTLMRVLDAAFGDEHSGRVLVHAALRTARRSSLPGEPDHLLDFVRAYMVGTLTEELGPRIVSALLDELAAELFEAPAPPSTGRRALTPRAVVPPSQAPATSDAPKSSGVRVRSNVALVDPDRFARASLARALVANGCDVSVADGALDVRSLQERIDVAIVSMNAPEVAAILGALVAKSIDPKVIAVTNDTLSAETLLRAVGVRSFRVVPKSVRVTELGDIIRHLAASR